MSRLGLGFRLGLGSRPGLRKGNRLPLRPRLRLNVPLALALLLLAGFAVMLVLPAIAELKDPFEDNLRLRVDGRMKWAPFRAGEAGFQLGTDRAGRDVVSRLIYGARYSLALTVGVTLVRAVCAVPIGLLTGWYGGRLYRFVQGVTVGFGAIPNLLLFVILVSAIKSVFGLPLPYWSVLLLLGLPRLTSLVADLTRHAATLDHIEAAQALGARLWRILLRHILPVIRGDLLIALATEASLVLVAMGQLAILDITYSDLAMYQGAANLAFTVDGLPEWAQMMGVNRQDIRLAPWVVVGPALCLGLAAAAFQLLAEGLRRRTGAGS